MGKKNRKELPLWVEIVAILLAGVIASIGLYLYIKDKNTNRYDVVFALGDGTILAQKTIKEGKGIIPPELDTDYVFRGWDKAINNIICDTEVHPLLYNIEDNNLFYFDSEYVKEGKTFLIDLILAGNVEISKCKLTMEYDEEVMEYKSCENSEFIKLEQESPGKLIIHFSSDENLKEKTELTQLKFYAKKKNVEYSQITLSASDVMLLSNGKEVYGECATINNNIYFLQEVG